MARDHDPSAIKYELARFIVSHGQQPASQLPVLMKFEQIKYHGYESTDFRIQVHCTFFVTYNT